MKQKWQKSQKGNQCNMRYHNITTADMMNGNGLRVCLWLSGCTHHCKNCQNPITWDENDGLEFDETAKKEIFSALSEEYISGITFTGGDPLHEKNIEKVLKLANEIRVSFPNKDIWLYTGYVVDGFLLSTPTSKEDKIRSEIIKQCDVVVDGRFVDELKDATLKWRGSSNQKVVDVNNTLKQNKIILYCD